MTTAAAVLAIMWIGLTAYALFGGADFGAGLWDLLAGGTERGRSPRRLIENSIGPVWEANHVWLIFVLVVLWTSFPPAFAAIASTLYIPLTLAALGMIARGAAFAFRHSVDELAFQRFFGAAFALSSVITPLFLGTIAGAVASGRVPPGIATGDVITSWLNPTSILGGVIAVGVCAYLAAVYLCADAQQRHDLPLVEYFRIRAIATAVVLGAIALAGIAVLRADAPQLFDGLISRGLALIVASVVTGIGSIVLLIRRRPGLARVAAALAVITVIWGWAVAQYPYLLQPALTVQAAAAPETTLRAMLISLVVGAALLVPSLVFLFTLFQRNQSDTNQGAKH
ncbi:MAG TPA: cytochrome d ubiquinol oxidase subunit II [Pseudonocardiaceae bacterium]|jgi:cytochrome d ubiquinol oxidase subunit II|nr:cytochrome d ubiquinol oxidase subunit II [Pseudonocardiaceae bacterium]